MVYRSSAVGSDVKPAVCDVMACHALVVDIRVIRSCIGQSCHLMQASSSCVRSTAACVAEFAGSSVCFGRCGMIVFLALTRSLCPALPVYIEELRTCDFCTSIASRLGTVAGRPIDSPVP